MKRNGKHSFRIEGFILIVPRDSRRKRKDSKRFRNNHKRHGKIRLEKYCVID